MIPNSEDQLDKFIGIWLNEDIGDGDHTTLSTIPSGDKGKARLLVKQPGIISGIRVAGRIYNQFDKDLNLEIFIKDGGKIKPGDVVFEIQGSLRSILQTERLVLNILQRMSGVSTQTREYVDKLNGLNTKVLDTRKTTPGIRLLEKEAVKLGGGENHRFGLYDMVLIKDNHIDFAGGIEQVLNQIRKYLENINKNLKIAIEARSLSDITAILRIGGVNRILIDNFNLEMTREAVKMIGSTCEIESSGGITIENIREYAECGVDYISVGALTHQIKSLDLSLKAAF